MRPEAMYFFICYPDMLKVLQRAADGEDPEHIALELYVNAQQHIIGPEDLDRE